MINSIIDFGCGELEFHTADIERLIKEKEYYKTQLAHLTKENKMLYVGISERKNTIEGFLKNKGLEEEYKNYLLNCNLIK